MTDYLCGNHTRGLPVAAFERNFEAYLKDTLGTKFEAAAAASGGRARLEMSGVLLLRSLCKLVCSGHGACAKGDGLEFLNWCEQRYPGVYNLKVGRAELSKRQDWMLEASEMLFALVKPMLEYLVETLKLDANVLRDSTLQRLELIHMEAFMHVSAATWTTCFKELRALTNRTITGLTPVELSEIYEELFKVGTLLQGENPLRILEQDHRPWERPERARGHTWHEAFDEGIDAKKVIHYLSLSLSLHFLTPPPPPHFW
jgi:hypothetical protein